MNYTEALAYLDRSCAIGYKHTLDILSGVIAYLRYPHQSLKIIHVAGTNGKGSVCAMLRSVLTAAGYLTGMFTSPHLDRVNERISIDGKPISDSDFAAQITRVKEATEQYYAGLQARRGGEPAAETESLSFFEILTVAALSYFSEKNVDYAILETGLGGRLDATNIVEKPVLTLITSIGIDHAEFLGGTLEEIAAEKAGIIKKNCPLVLCSQQEKVYNVINNICLKKNAELYYDSDVTMDMVVDSPVGLSVDIRSPYYAYQALTISLAGNYQTRNLRTVLLAVHVLQKSGIHIREESLRAGLARAFWPGRMEIIGCNPLTMIDGAHNTDAVLSLKDSLLKYFPGKKITLVIGVCKDKNYADMMNIIADVADTVILTMPDHNGRALPPETLRTVIKDKNKTVMLESDYKKAVDLALGMTAGEDVVCCTGSLYLVGDIRKYICSR